MNQRRGIGDRICPGVALLLATAAAASAGDPQDILVRQQRQALMQDATGHACWQVKNKEQKLPARETAIILCDVWDRHWSRGATERVEKMAPRMNEVVRVARARGVTIIHAPSDTMDFYKDAPARKRVQQAPRSEPPKDLPHEDPPLPIDDSDGGSDTGEPSASKAWTRQHPAIEIDPAVDGVSDSGQEVWNFLQQRRIRHVIIMGVHTNMCILGRSFAIKQMVRWGMDVMLVRDLTDAMYNPAARPYVSHDEGTRLVIEYIEKFWCPTIASEELLRNRPETRAADQAERISPAPRAGARHAVTAAGAESLDMVACTSQKRSP
jgi:nicotinamidase-related amidase